MILIRNLNQINQQLPGTAITIGNFDGVHLAHQNIIQRTNQIAKSKNLKSAILSFEPHPILFLNKTDSGFNNNFRITNLAKKIQILFRLGLDYVIIIPFNKYLSSLSANSFIEDILIKKINTQSIVIGYDFTFGKNREGNFKTLEQYNFDLHEITPIKYSSEIDGDLTISSSLARRYIQSGKIRSLSEILGRNFEVDGIVIKGNSLGHKLGYNTANIKSKSNIIRPKFGVYKTRTFIHKFGKSFDSITNFGIRPTIISNFSNQTPEPIYETHILNFSHNIYNQKITIHFLDFIREEKKFSSITELQNQIKIDLAN